MTIERSPELNEGTGVNDRDWWTIHRGSSPIFATAIHEGYRVRSAVQALLAISQSERLREEDPFTEFFIRDVPNRIVLHRSRFEVDLNRSRDSAIYLSPEQSWGVDIWKKKPGPDIVEDSLALHDAYYAMLEQMLADHERRHGGFVLLDVHSYNHRRGGPDAPPSDPESAPEINIGTFSMDRERWAHIVDPFIEKLRGFAFRGQRPDVRENIAFQGKGEQTRFIHETFPQTGCAIAIEFKKFFMDEWTGEPDRSALVAMRALIASTVPVLEESLRAAR
ncbi:MAG: N-formylglutamate amidohydrolase [Phyllobacterium sp.]